MKTRIVVIALSVAALGFLGTARTDAQVSIGIGIHFNVPLPPPPPLRYEVAVEAPYRDAVWIRGNWFWDEYAGRYVWVSGHWVPRYHQPVYRHMKYRNVPKGVAKGWWKKHGYEYGR